MTRVVDWHEWRTRPAALAGAAARHAERRGPHRSGGRRRDEADVAIITHMVHVEVERRLAEGRLVRLGPREYELHPRMATAPTHRTATMPS